MLKVIVSAQNAIHSFSKDREGATAIEYGLIAAGIAIAIIVVVGTLGDELSEMFTAVETAINAR